MPQGLPKITIQFLRERIANGEIEQVKDEFMRYQMSLTTKSTQTQDLKIESNPDEIYALLNSYAIALGASVPSVFGGGR